MTKRSLLLLLSALLMLAGGCGEDVEVRMQRAQIALQSNKPDQALQLASTVLAEQPDNIQAVNVVAASQLRLGRLDDARQTVMGLLSRQPDNLEARQMMINWSYHRLNEILRQSELPESTALQDEFVDVSKKGMEHVDWFHNQAKKPAEADYFRALFADRDAQRMKLMLDRLRGGLQAVQLPGEQPDESQNERVARLESQYRQRVNEVDDHLRRALEGRPGYFQAASMRLALLKNESRWQDMANLIEHIGNQKEVPPVLSADVVTSLAQMPADALPMERRITLGQAVQDKVSEKGRKNPVWTLTSGRLLVMQHKYAEGEKVLRQAVQQKPKDIEGRFLLAFTLLQLAKIDEAKQLMDKLAVEAPRHSRVQTLYGQVLMRAGERGMARDVLRRAIELDPNDDDSAAREAMVMLLAEDGSLSAAEADVSEYLARNPTDPRALDLKLQFERSRANKQEVEQLLARIEGMTPRLDAYLGTLINGYSYLGKHADVERVALELVQRHPEDITGYLQLASAKLAQGQADQVRQLLQEVGEKFPQSTAIDAMVGRLYVRNNEHDKAVEVLERHLQAKPDDQQARLDLAQALASLLLTDEAMDQIKQVLESNPRDLKANAMAARIYAITGKPELAREHLSQIDEGLVSEQQHPALLAQLRLEADDVEEAKGICNRAIAQGNSDPVLRLILAGIYQRSGSVDEAEVHLLALVRSQPSSPQAFNMLSRFYSGNRMIDKGLVELTKLQQLNEVYARVTQAQLLSSVKKYQEAAIALEPLFSSMVRNGDRQVLYTAEALARVYAAGGDESRAAGVYQRLIDARLHTQQARLRQFDLSFNKDDQPTRLAKLDAIAASLQPNQMALVRLVAQRYALSGKPQNGLAMIDQWLARHPNHASLLLWKGDLYVRMEDFRAAADTFRLATAAAPGNIELHSRLALALEGAGDFPAAEQAFRQMAEMGGAAKIVGLTHLGRLYVTIGLNRQAARIFADLEREGRPRDPRVLLTMGKAYNALHRYDLAAAKLAEVPNYAPQYVQAQVLLARVEQAQGLVDAAQKRLSELARDVRWAAVAARETLRLQIETKQRQELLWWIDQYLPLESLSEQDKAQWLRLRIGILCTQKRWQPALEAVEQLVLLEPQTVAVRAARLALMVSLQRVEQAKRLYQDDPAIRGSAYAAPLAAVVGLPVPQQAVEAPAYYRYLLALIEGNGSAAAELVDQIPQMATNFHHDMRQVAQRSDLGNPALQAAVREAIAAAICLESGLPHLSLELATAATGRVRDLPLAWGLVAEGLRQTNQPLLPTLAPAKQIAGSAIALYAQAEEHSMQIRHAAAAEALVKVAELTPGNPHVQYRLVNALQSSGDFNKAIAVLEQMLLSPNTPYAVPARNDLAYLLAEHQPQRLDQAYELAKQALAAAPSGAALQDTLAWVQHLRGKNAEALQLVSEALMEIGHLPEVQYHAGVIFKAVGNPTWARYYLEEVSQSDTVKLEKKRAAELLANWGKQ